MPFNPFAGSFGGNLRTGQPNYFGQNLRTMTEPGQMAAFGYGTLGDNQQTKDYTYQSLLNNMSPYQSNATNRALLNPGVRNRIDQGYAEYQRQTGGQGHYGDYLGGLDVNQFVQGGSPYDMGRQYANPAYRVRFGG